MGCNEGIFAFMAAGVDIRQGRREGFQVTVSSQERRQPREHAIEEAVAPGASHNCRGHREVWDPGGADQLCRRGVERDCFFRLGIPSHQAVLACGC